VRTVHSGYTRTVCPIFRISARPDTTKGDTAFCQQAPFLYPFQDVGGKIGDLIFRVLLHKLFQLGQELLLIPYLQGTYSMQEHKFRTMLSHWIFVERVLRIGHYLFVIACHVFLISIGIKRIFQVLAMYGDVGKVRIGEHLGILTIRETVYKFLLVNVGICHAIHTSQHEVKIIVCHIQLAEVREVMNQPSEGMLSAGEVLHSVFEYHSHVEQTV